MDKVLCNAFDSQMHCIETKSVLGVATKGMNCSRISSMTMYRTVGAVRRQGSMNMATRMAVAGVLISACQHLNPSQSSAGLPHGLYH